VETHKSSIVSIKRHLDVSQLDITESSQKEPHGELDNLQACDDPRDNIYWPGEAAQLGGLCTKCAAVSRIEGQDPSVISQQVLLWKMNNLPNEPEPGCQDGVV